MEQIEELREKAENLDNEIAETRRQANVLVAKLERLRSQRQEIEVDLIRLLTSQTSQT